MLTKVPNAMLGSEFVPITGGTFTGEIAVQDGLQVSGRLAANAAVVAEFDDPTDVLLAFRRTGLPNVTDEVAILGYAQDDGGSFVKTFSISEHFVTTAAATRYSVLRLNATYATAGVGADYLGVRIFGNKGVTINGKSDIDFPTDHNVDARLLVREPAVSVVDGTSSQYHWSFRNNGSVSPVTVGGITSSGSTTAYGTSSDANLKDDDGELTFDQARAILDLITFHNFRWKLDGKQDHGVFAQELHEVYPSAVVPGSGVPGDLDFIPWSVDYSKLMTIVARCMQGVMAKQDAFEQRLTAAGL